MNRIFATLAFLASLGFSSVAAAQANPLPHFIQGSESPVLMVDGRPFTALGAQVQNSSNYPEMLDLVWPVIDRLEANTLLVPVAWEQVEPVEGGFDFSFVDTLLAQAREQDVRIAILWYGTWKNTGPGYVPRWVKQDTARFPRMRRPDGTTHMVLSPHGRETMEADARAFSELMAHLASTDPQHTVIMVQVENETGSWGLDRDYSEHAAALFEAAIPQELAAGLGIEQASWRDAFGTRAEQFFMSWHVARYVNHVAEAGSAQKDLPMFVNAALGNAFTDEHGDVGPSGGPNWNALPIWRIAAPAIAATGPDIYTRDAREVSAYLDHYAQPGPLIVPEIGNAAEYSRFIWPAMGRGAVLFAPFGMDHSGYSNYPLGADELDAETIEAFAAPYRLFASAAGDWARLVSEHDSWGTARGEDGEDQSHVMGRWKLTAQYARWQFGEDDWTWIEREEHPLADTPTGGLVAIQLDADSFLVGGRNIRLRIALADPATGELSEVIEAQEGHYANGVWHMRRRWNGDQVDYGFNFGQEPVWLRIEMGSYR